MERMTAPLVCIKCGHYINSRPFEFNNACCEHCGYDGGVFLEFYDYCNRLENGLIHNYAVTEKLKDTARTELNHGWAPDLLAIISAMILGILTNASYDLIKEWVLSKRAEYGRRYHLFEYEKAVEALLVYLIDNAQQIKEFKIGNEEINIKFKSHLASLKNEIESMAKNENQIKPNKANSAGAKSRAAD